MTWSKLNLDTFNAWCTQVHKAKYLMNMQYPILRTPEIIWVQYHIFWQFKGYCITLPKPRIFLKLHWLNYNTFIGLNYNTLIGPHNNTPPKVSHKYIRFHNIFFDMWKGNA
jgi:hypothetical protein